MGMILRIASSRIVGQGDIVGRSGYFSLNLSANSVMRGRLDARRTLKSLVADLRVIYIFSEVDIEGFKKRGHGHYPPTRYQYCTQENHGHGRTEKRICRVISYQSYTEKIVHWEGVRSLVCIENTRTDNKTGETTSENHYYITSLPMDAETILNVARKHWGIENNLHWQLDVSFNEDNQKKKNNAAQNISLINKIALARIKQDETKGSMKAKRKRAGWDSSFLAKLIP
jgi:predicted transposase YbfD/YdcC